jgi:hypothetical protein
MAEFLMDNSGYVYRESQLLGHIAVLVAENSPRGTAVRLWYAAFLAAESRHVIVERHTAREFHT